jgi:hypothetical protein
MKKILLPSTLALATLLTACPQNTDVPPSATQLDLNVDLTGFNPAWKPNGEEVRLTKGGSSAEPVLASGKLGANGHVLLPLPNAEALTSALTTYTSAKELESVPAGCTVSKKEFSVPEYKGWRAGFGVIIPTANGPQTFVDISETSFDQATATLIFKQLLYSDRAYSQNIQATCSGGITLSSKFSLISGWNLITGKTVNPGGSFTSTPSIEISSVPITISAVALNLVLTEVVLAPIPPN